MRMIVMFAAGILLAGCGVADAPRDDGDPAETSAADVEGATPPAQSAQPGEPLASAEGDVALTIAATLDGRRYEAEGTGECKHAPDAYIYGTPSAMWLVQYRGSDIRSLSLTLWRPKSGDEDMLSLNVSTRDATSSISTVERGEPAGSASAHLEIEGAGGRFIVDGRDEEGHEVALEIRCTRFGSVEAVGG